MQVLIKKVLLEKIIGYLEDCQDEGPHREGWKSKGLEMTIERTKKTLNSGTRYFDKTY